MTQPEPCNAEPETDEQRADRLETARQHAAGDHQYCELDCEAKFPSEMLRNGILAKGYPGTTRMLDELLRRTAASWPVPAASGDLRQQLADAVRSLFHADRDAPPGTVADAVLPVVQAETESLSSALDEAQCAADGARFLTLTEAATWFDTSPFDEHLLQNHDRHMVSRHLRRMATEAQLPTTGQEPIQLRWGLDDVMYGDDETTTVMLSGKNGQPYWLPLEPERAAAMREALAGPSGGEQQR